MKKYRIGIIGCGGVAKFHTEGWQAWKKNCSMTALCDINPAQIKRLKGEFPDFVGKAEDSMKVEAASKPAGVKYVFVQTN